MQLSTQVMQRPLASDSRRVRQGIRTVTGYNSSGSTHAQSPSLRDDLNPNKTTGPDVVPGRVLKHCAGELTAVLTHLFYTSLLQASVPACLKTATIIHPVPKQSAIRSLNDYRPVALALVFRKWYWET